MIRGFHRVVSGLLLTLSVVATATAQTTVQWQSAVTGTWFTAGNWSPAVVPDFATPNSYRALISATGPSYTVTASGSNSVDIAGLDVSSASARVIFDFTSSSFGLNLGSGASSWSAGNVEFRTGNGIVGASNTATTLAVGSGVELLFSTSTGTRTLGSLSLNNAGVLRATSGALSLSNLVLTNQAGALIHADGAEIQFQNTTTFSNSGTLRATGANGVLRFNGAFSTASLGTIDLVSGGHARLYGTLNNTSATLNAPSGGSYELLGGIITGGTIGSGALSLTTSGGTLNSVTLTGALNLSTSAFATLSGANVFSSATATFGTNSSLRLDNANASLAIDAGSAATGELGITANSSVGTVLTNAGTLTHNVTGTGTLVARSFANSGTIVATSGTLNVGSTTAGYSTLNTGTGTITANGSAATINLNGAVQNLGVLSAQGSGTLLFAGTNSTPNLGNVQLSTGGRARLNGTLNNTASTLTAPTGGAFELYGGTIAGGTIGSGALTFTTSGGTLNNVTLTGTLNLGTSTYATLAGTNMLSGSTVTFGVNSGFRLDNANASLAINAASTASGELGITANSVTGTSLTNAGTLTHNVTGTGSLYARSFTNSGSISATSGTLNVGSTTVGYSTVNSASGAITANGSTATVNLNGDVQNLGVLSAQNSGTLLFAGNNITPNLGTVQLTTGGRARLNGTLNNVETMLPAPTGGPFELYGGIINGGTIASNALTFTTSGGTLTDVTLSGILNLGTSTYATLAGINALSGSTVSFGVNSGFRLDNANATLSINAASTASGELGITANSATGTSLTNAGTLTHNVTGTGSLYARSFTNSGSISATSGTLNIGSTTSGYSTINSAPGVITANGSTAIVNLNGDVQNLGVLSAQNSGTLLFAGNNITPNLGNVQLSTGGRARLNGTLNNVEATLPAPTGGPFELYAGTINGGTIASNALTFTTSGGTLAGVTLTGVLNLGTSTFATLSGANTLSGSTVTFGVNSGFRLDNASAALAINAASTASGELGITANNAAGTSLTNAGTLTHNVTGTGSLYARSFTNSGAISATSGTLNVGSTTAGYSTINAAPGTITANGSGATINLNGDVQNLGVLSAQNSGTLLFAGNNITPNLGTVQLSTGGRARLNGTLNNSDATLAGPSGGPFELYAGTINGGTIASNALTFTTSGGTLNGVTLTGTLNLGTSVFATLSGANVLSGSTVSFGVNSGFRLDTSNASLTINSASTATGELGITATSGATGTAVTNAGTLTHSVTGTGSLYARTFTNSGSITATSGTLNIGTTTAGYSTINSATGTITANGGTATINLNGNVQNLGVLSAQNSGTLLFDGNNTTANLGTVQLSAGGRALLDGTLNNTAATLTAPSGGPFSLYGGTINGGTIGSGALTFTTSGGTLNGVMLSGTLNLGASTFAALAGANFLSGSSVTFATNSAIRLDNTNASLSIGSGSTATGELGILANSSTGTALTNLGTLTHNVSGTGSLYARTFTNSGSIIGTNGMLTIGTSSAGYSTFNTSTGSIIASGSGSTVSIYGGFTNQGSLLAENSGSLIFEGSHLTSGLGAVQILNGGHARIRGTLDNTASTLVAPSGGSFELYSGTITGGTIGHQALTLTTSGGTLNGVTIAGGFNLGTSSSAQLSGVNSFNGADVTFGVNSSLFLNSGASLDITAASTVIGDISITAAAGSTLTNHASVTHTTGSGFIFAANLTNAGSLNVNAGFLTLGTTAAGYTVTNSPGGTFTVNGGTAILLGSTTNEGLLRVQSGTLMTNGVLTSQGDGVVTGAGTINGGITIAGGTVAPGNSIGSLTLLGGAFNITAATVFEFELGGPSSDGLVFVNPTAPVNLGAGLVTLSLTLLSAPTLATSYDLVRISSGGSGITGTFANLPTTGSTITAHFADLPYVFTVNYGPNAITLQSVPEPGTYALMGVGLIGLWMARRRRASRRS